MDLLGLWQDWVTAWGAPVAAVLGAYILLSGLDDAALDVAWLVSRRRKRAEPPDPPRERRIAVLVPLWQEASVIGRMLEHNLASIRYSNYEFYVGVYPNDEATADAVRRVAARDARVHLAEVPHEGPTSKADCLNWVYQRLIEREMQTGVRAEIVVIHDAEDVIHPDSFARFNRWISEAGMLQEPVLALPTPAVELTHGVYCDDFAESQIKDLPARVWLGGFLPGCGVGTAFRREELDRLAETESNRIFDPLCLTEDYDNGLRLFQLGCRQMVLPVQGGGLAATATREYFPRNWRAAVRQRTRWMTGNGLQAWERHGWGRPLPGRWTQAWFFWRDRKGLWGSWIGLASNMLFLACAAEWAAARLAGAEWRAGCSAGSQPVAGSTARVQPGSVCRAGGHEDLVHGAHLRVDIRRGCARQNGLGQRHQCSGISAGVLAISSFPMDRRAAAVAEDGALLPVTGEPEGTEASLRRRGRLRPGLLR